MTLYLEDRCFDSNPLSLAIRNTCLCVFHGMSADKHRQRACLLGLDTMASRDVV